MTILILKMFLVAAAVILVAFSAIQAFRNARRLDRRIEALKKEHVCAGVAKAKMRSIVPRSHWAVGH